VKKTFQCDVCLFVCLFVCIYRGDRPSVGQTTPPRAVASQGFGGVEKVIVHLAAHEPIPVVAVARR
jgi:hypothetical protein